MSTWIYVWKDYGAGQCRCWRESCPQGNMVPWKYNLMAKVTRWCYCAHYWCARVTIAHTLKRRFGVSLWDELLMLKWFAISLCPRLNQSSCWEQAFAGYCLADSSSQGGHCIGAILTTAVWVKVLKKKFSFLFCRSFPSGCMDWTNLLVWGVTKRVWGRFTETWLSPCSLHNNIYDIVYLHNIDI